MPLYTIEVNGRPTMVFAAEDRMEADALVEAEWLRSDLRALKHDGLPLWDGEAELVVREAWPEEAGKWDTDFARACGEGDADDGDRESWPVFLVAVEDPTGDDLPDDEAPDEE